MQVIETTPGPTKLGLNTPEGLTPSPLQTALPEEQLSEKGGLFKHTGPTSVTDTVGV